MASWSIGSFSMLAPRDWQALKMLLPFVFEFKYRFAFCLLCLVLIQIANLANPYLLGALVDHFAVSGASDIAVIATIPVTLLLIYVFTRFAGLALSEIQNAVFGTVTVRGTRRLSLVLLTHLHGLDLEYHLSRKTGGLSRDMDRGIGALTGLIRLFTFSLFGMFMSIAGVVGVFIAFFGWSYAAISVVCAVIYAIYTVKVTAWRTPIIRRSNEAHSRAHTRAIDSLINHENVKYFGNERAETSLYDQQLTIWERARARNRYSLAALNIGQAFVVQFGLLFMLGLACYGVVQGEYTPGQLVMLNGYALQVFGPLGALGSIYRQLKQAFTDVEAMLDILDTQPSVSSHENAPLLPEGDGPIEFRNVHFFYKPDRPILKGVSFTVNPGEKVALVGPSGGGKSTIARLLFRFYDIHAGSISVNGIDIRELNLDSLRARIGVVPQDTTLFNDTLAQNIQYGLLSATQDDLRAAAHMAHLDSLIDMLPDGMETVVGERGLKLSGGEKQRVAIARTMLKRPTFLVFDEATSSLDSATEASIMHAITEVSEGHTTLMIAHRLSTVIDADRILVLAQGEICESGSHDELLAQHGHYEQLWKLQHREIDHETFQREANRRFSHAQ
ncbi:MAG: ABC transporter ATP-binding protein/permease [Gammaproteobacteria bacterium]|nr:ABC transporter ATP-binding protein/permease [Gammaproteobacteria bacterium]